MRTQIAFKDLPKEDKDIIRSRHSILVHCKVWTEADEIDEDGETWTNGYRMVYAKLRLWTIIFLPFLIFWGIVAAVIEELKEIPLNLKGYFTPYKIFSYRTTEITKEDLE